MDCDNVTLLSYITRKHNLFRSLLSGGKWSDISSCLSHLLTLVREQLSSSRPVFQTSLETRLESSCLKPNARKEISKDRWSSCYNKSRFVVDLKTWSFEQQTIYREKIANYAWMGKLSMYGHLCLKPKLVYIKKFANHPSGRIIWVIVEKTGNLQSSRELIFCKDLIYLSVSNQSAIRPRLGSKHYHCFACFLQNCWRQLVLRINVNKNSGRRHVYFILFVAIYQCIQLLKQLSVCQKTLNETPLIESQYRSCG